MRGRRQELCLTPFGDSALAQGVDQSVSKCTCVNTFVYTWGANGWGPKKAFNSKDQGRANHEVQTVN